MPSPESPANRMTTRSFCTTREWSTGVSVDVMSWSFLGSGASTPCEVNSRALRVSFRPAGPDRSGFALARRPVSPVAADAGLEGGQPRLELVRTHGLGLGAHLDLDRRGLGGHARGEAHRALRRDGQFAARRGGPG